MIFQRIQELCKKNSTSIEQLERKLNFGHGTIYRWKNGKATADNLKIVADFFGVSVDYLIGDEKETVEELRQKLYDADPDARTLLCASDGLTSEEIKAVAEMIKVFKATK